jgi:hypothetical protein
VPVSICGDIETKAGERTIPLNGMDRFQKHRVGTTPPFLPRALWADLRREGLIHPEGSTLD